jgi:predicted DNA-binding protein with PD1-like motif
MAWLLTLYLSAVMPLVEPWKNDVVKRVAALLVVGILAGCASTASPPARTFAVRLGPGEDLRGALEKLTTERGLRAGYVVTCVGSLRQAAIRFADREQPEIVQGPLEIVSLVGTLSPDGPHLHISVSDGQGRTIGGHLAAGAIVYTTAEIVVAEVPGVAFARTVDPQTTFRELEIRKLP